jgi:plasmid stabilization system protein ParE
MIRDRVNNLTVFPEIGAVVSEFGVHRVREVHVFSYRIFYRYNGDEEIIEVLSVFHMSRQLTPDKINEILYTEP